MTTFFLFLVALPAPQAPPASPVLARAEVLLVAGDTAVAVAHLRDLAQGGRAMHDDALAAHFALQWIGRTPRWAEARHHSIGAARKLPTSRPAPPDPVRLLQRAAWVEEWRRTRPGRPVPADEQDLIERLVQEAVNHGSERPWVAGAAHWLAGQVHLVAVDDGLLAAMPTLRRLPPTCPRARARQCVVTGPRPAQARSLRAVAWEDTAVARHLEFAQQALRSALGAPWPFSEMAARTLVAAEIPFGAEASQLELVAVLAEAPLHDRTRAELTAVLFEFAGRREAAESVMASAPQWFGELDRALGALEGVREMTPEVVWRTAWPLYLEPTNERLTVHRVRLLAGAALERAVPPAGSVVFGLDSVSTRFVRLGLPVAVARYADRSRSVVVPFLDGRTREMLVRRVSGDPLAVPLDLALAVRDPAGPGAPSGYVDRHFDDFSPLEHQVAQFFRDDRPHVEVYTMRPLARCPFPEPVVGFFLLDQRLGLVRRSVDTVPVGAPPRHAYLVRVDPGVYVYSAEFLDGGCRQAARARYVLTVRAPAGTLDLSDVVLAEARSVEGAVRVVGPPRPAARAGLTARADEPVHLYWEVYGVAAAAAQRERLAVELEVVDVRRGPTPVRFLTAVAGAAARTAPRLDLTYELGVPPGDGPLASGLSLGLEPGAQGLHVVRVRVRDRVTGEVAAAQRAFYVLPPP